MPRRSVILSAAPIDAPTVAEAAGSVWERLSADQPGVPEFSLLPVEDAVLQVLGSGETLLTVTRSVLPVGDGEIARLLPSLGDASVGAARVWTAWTEAFTPWSAGGLIGVAIVERIVLAAHGLCHHDQL